MILGIYDTYGYACKTNILYKTIEMLEIKKYMYINRKKYNAEKYKRNRAKKKPIKELDGGLRYEDKFI